MLYLIRHTTTSSGYPNQVFTRCCNLHIVGTTVWRQRYIVKVANDVLLNTNSQRVTLLVLLDLSATLDTADHAILLRRLNTSFGIRGKALEWFSSYLLGRSLCTLFDGDKSDSSDLRFGVSQGSCLDPLLFVVYASAPT